MKHIVGFSGGIDSQACARWVLNRFPKQDVILLNSDAGGNEHPMTTEFIEAYSRDVHPVVTVKAIVGDMGNRCRPERERRLLLDSDSLTFDLLADLKGVFPSRRKQFCTEHLKLLPQVRWTKEHITEDFERYIGVRRDESINRRETPIRQWDDLFDCWLNAPLADWTKQMCFDYVAAHGEQINELYRLGFNRVGCAPCVNSNKEDILNWVNRAPEMIDKVRAWEQRIGRTFFGPIMPGGSGNKRRYGYIDEIVEWARTTHGGKQLSILSGIMEPCSSKYGLCE